MQKKKNIPFGAEQDLRNCIELLLISLARRSAGNSFKEDRPVGAFNADEVVKYVNENFKEKITIDELSFIFGTNRSSLCKDFKTRTGKSLNGYVIEKRLEEARRLLNETDDTITEIADRLNFTGIHYFTAFFKKATGLSPTEYREKSRQK